VTLYQEWFGSTPEYRRQSWHLLGIAVLLSPLILVLVIGLWIDGRRSS
jgi:hypothetical protein